MKGKFLPVVSCDIDMDRSLIRLVLKCGHAIEQKRSRSYLKKEQFNTLRTPQDKPLKAHCNVCKDIVRLENPQDKVRGLINNIEVAGLVFQDLLNIVGQQWQDAKDPERLSRLQAIKKILLESRQAMAMQIPLLEEIEKEL